MSPAARRWAGPAVLIALLGIAVSEAEAAPAKGTGKSASVVPFMEDDYAGALAAAKRAGKLLFVDAWAPWCHTCLSMRSYVFTDARLTPFAKRFVWLAIDTEKDSSAAFLKAHPIEAWPTLLVIDPLGKQPVRLWKGALTAAELVAWLDEAGGRPVAADDPGNKARAIDARVGALRRQGDNAGCVKAAGAALPTMAPGTSRLNVAMEGLTCAQRLPAGEARQTNVTQFSSELLRIVSDREFPILADDRSSGYEALVDSAEQAKDTIRARDMAARWASFLEEQAGRATDAAGRAVFDAHRLVAYLALGQPERAIPVLQTSAKAFPRDYNPPARLARAFLAAGRLPEARAAINRALGLVYGPRRKRLEALEAEITAAERAGGKRASR